MVDYSIFPLDEEIKDKLAKLEISYAFQPIFYPNGRDIYAYELSVRTAMRIDKKKWQR